MCRPYREKKEALLVHLLGYSDNYRTESSALLFLIENKCAFAKPQLGKKAILGKEASIKSTCWKCLHIVPEKYTTGHCNLQFVLFKIDRERTFPGDPGVLLGKLLKDTEAHHRQSHSKSKAIP